MSEASVSAPARFRPTWQQAVCRGLYLGVLVSVAAVSGGLFALMAGYALLDTDVAMRWLWLVLGFGPPVLGIATSVLLCRRLGVEIDARGIRTVTPFARALQPWSKVTDLRAERRGNRTVVSVYLKSGASVQLRAPYSGELLAADPRFELKVFALSNLWRSHRFGGVSS